KNTATINDINGRLDGTSQQVDKNTAAINDINGRLDGTSQQLEGAISRGETELAQIKEDVATNTGAIKDTSERLESSLEEQKKVNVLVGNALASNENYWQQQWATNENYAASINQNTSAIAQNRQDINKLNSRVDRLDQKVDDLNDTMKRGFASQAALNGLFQPYGVGKLNATMALGGYESKTAIAAGTGYRFDENTAVKAGIATNTDDFKGVTYNVGVNFEW
ncbi:YadA-like family protein, partial [Providencia stuartii]